MKSYWRKCAAATKAQRAAFWTAGPNPSSPATAFTLGMPLSFVNVRPSFGLLCVFVCLSMALASVLFCFVVLFLFFVSLFRCFVWLFACLFVCFCYCPHSRDASVICERKAVFGFVCAFLCLSMALALVLFCFVSFRFVSFRFVSFCFVAFVFLLLPSLSGCFCQL